MTRPTRITVAVLGTAVIVVATTGTSWLIAALDGPLLSIPVVVGCGIGALMGLGRGLKVSAREPSWRAREGRRDGYVSDGDTERDVIPFGAGRVLYTHPASRCAGRVCCIHNPSGHSMRSFPQLWRGDRGLMERVCPHGVGHPDPDDIAFKRMSRGAEFALAESVHGCDGCCRRGGGPEVDLELVQGLDWVIVNGGIRDPQGYTTYPEVAPVDDDIDRWRWQS